MPIPGDIAEHTSVVWIHCAVGDPEQFHFIVTYTHTILLMMVDSELSTGTHMKPVYTQFHYL